MYAITINKLGKAYKHYPTRWSRLREWLDPRHQPRHQLNQVLQDISLHVLPGEAVGIIGINGAGKSTLLKAITGTTRPSSGYVQVNGRVAALLELGMGFHGEFTGRQNTYMAGQLLGYSMEEINRLMPEIEAFAEIGDYIDQPVRVYSSGMQMRLAFSVATAIRPDVLIVDEALSVGDVYFQHKSFERIRQFSQQGTTLLIVSHDKQAIQNICDRAILLNAGRLVMEGKPAAVMDYYNAMLAERNNATQDIRLEQRKDGHAAIRSGTGEAVICRVDLFNEAGEQTETVNVGEPVTLKIGISINTELPSLVCGYIIKDRLGQVIFGTNTHQLNTPLSKLAKGRQLKLEFSFAANMGPGSYSVTVALHTGESHIADNYDWQDLALLFTVVNIDRAPFNGSGWLPPQICVVDD